MERLIKLRQLAFYYDFEIVMELNDPTAPKKYVLSELKAGGIMDKNFIGCL